MLASSISLASIFILSINAIADSPLPLRSSQSLSITNKLASLELLPPFTNENPLITKYVSISGYLSNLFESSSVTFSVLSKLAELGSCTVTKKYPKSSSGKNSLGNFMKTYIVMTEMITNDINAIAGFLKNDFTILM